MNGTIRIKNRGAVELSFLPLLPFEDFASRVEQEMTEAAELVACFAHRPAMNSWLEIYALIGDPGRHDLAVLRGRLPARFPSLTRRHPQFHLFEREIAEQYGAIPEGHPWLKPVRFHQVWEGGIDAFCRDPGTHPVVGDMRYYQVEGEAVHEVGVGPVHAGIIEPGHFRFQCFGERVLHLEISLGYQHRGAERLFIGGPHPQTPYQMETLAGDTTIGHMTAYCQMMEALAGVAPPRRAVALRAVALELERLANHVGDIGALAGDVGFLPTASYCGRLRGDYLNMTALLCGSRFGRGLARPGGVIFDLAEEMKERLSASLRQVRGETEGAVNLFFTTPSVLGRLEGTGKVSIIAARDLGLTGPAGRACGLDTDCRRNYPAPWEEEGLAARKETPPLLAGEDGDVFARALVRKLEIDHATDAILAELSVLPPGRARRDFPGARPDMLAVSLVEGWRGRIAHIGLTDGHGRLARYKVVDPSFFNWSGLAMALRDEQISDFPLCNKSFNLSYCGFDL